MSKEHKERALKIIDEITSGKRRDGITDMAELRREVEGMETATERFCREAAQEPM